MRGRFGRAHRLAGLVLLANAFACRDSARGPAPEQAVLGGEIVARVGTERIPVSLVARVAADQQITPREALRRLIDDAVAANGARTRGLDRGRPASWLLAAARGRWIADRVMGSAREGGPPTDAEIAELTRLHWREVDRPPSVRVVHVVVQRPKVPDEAASARARALAEEIRTAVLSAKDGDDFQAKAKAVPHPADVDVVAQPLPAFTIRGELTEAEGGMVEPFAQAAHALGQAGETSGVVESSFGWHVIRLIERIPEQRMPYEARRTAFAEETLMQRARRETQARLADLKTTTPIELSPSSERLMESLLDRGPSP